MSGKDQSKEQTHTRAVRVGEVQLGGGAPVAVQSMTNTDTGDAAATARQCLELAQAGSELVRFTVDGDRAAKAVPEIRKRLDDAGAGVPLIGDFHYNGHLLLRRFPECASTLDKYRINPGNVGQGERRDDNFATICKLARDHGKTVRIGVNGGSLDSQLLAAMMRSNAEEKLGRSAAEIRGQCMVTSALRSAELAVANGLAEDRIVLSAKVSEPPEMIAIYRNLAASTQAPLHLGLTEAGIGLKGLVWSSAALAVLLAEGIGDTIRVSLTPRPGGDRCEEVWAACELLQALGKRSFAPIVTACPGCGRTTSTTFQELAVQVQDHLRQQLPQWRQSYPGVVNLRVAVMGCIVNGPGESRAADIGISLPGSGEEPRCPVYVGGRQHSVIQGESKELGEQFIAIINAHVAAMGLKETAESTADPVATGGCRWESGR